MAFSLTKEESYANISNILVWKLHVKGKKHHTQIYFKAMIQMINIFIEAPKIKTNLGEFA